MKFKLDMIMIKLIHLPHQGTWMGSYKHHPVIQGHIVALCTGRLNYRVY